MESNLAIILGMAAISYLIRLLPQLFIMGRRFPEALDRYLRYVSYALISSIISTTLFIAGGRFQADVAPARALALAAAVLLAYASGKPLVGLFGGTFVALALSWIG